MSKRMFGNLALLLTAVIWGSSFVAQSVGMDYVGPFTFQAVRSLLGGLVLIPVIFLMDRRGNDRKPATAAQRKKLLLSGIACGILLFIACILQQIGIQYITAGKSGFLTALYLIMVPLFSLFLGKRVTPWIWVSIFLAVSGLYLLCGGGVFSLGKGELLTLGCAIGFSFHILLIDRVSPQLDGVRLSCLQFFVCGFISLLFMFFTEKPSLSTVLPCWLPICYSGILSAGAGYTLQIVGQAVTDPTTASLLMSLESVFSVIFGWLILHQSLSTEELLGCLLVFSGVILVQIPHKKANKSA